MSDVTHIAQNAEHAVIDFVYTNKTKPCTGLGFFFFLRK